MIRCSNCKTEKPISEYYNANNTKYGKQGMCIPCYKAYFKAWRASRNDKPQSVHVDSKVCLDCGLERPISQFGKKSTSLDKHNIYCKECWRQRCKGAQRKYYARKKANG